MHPNLVICAETIEDAIDLMANHGVYNSVSERQRKCIRDCYHIKFSIVDTYPDLSDFLGYYNDGTQARGPL